MENIGDMLSRAIENRRRRKMRPVQEARSAPSAARHQSSHASYTALMRSHDRVATRHIAGKGGGSGA